MIRRFRFDGAGTPFEGRREVRWDGLPAGAEVVSARAVVTPHARGVGGAPFVERIDFTGADPGQGDRGATKRLSPGAVEVDFHGRRTLHAVAGSGLAGAPGAELLVDLGGVFNRVSAAGALGVPEGADPFRLSGESAALPGLAVTRIRLVRGGFSPDVQTVWFTSVPTNVSLALGDLPPFFVRPGELATPETTPDFTAVLQSLVGEPEVPLVLASDTLARLTVELVIDYRVTTRALPEGLDQVTVHYDHGSLPKEPLALPPVLVPRGHRVCATRGRAVGAFAASRVVWGETGVVTPAGAVGVAPTESQARKLDLAAPLGTDAVDLLLSAVDRTVSLELDARPDLDGKPADTSLLGGPVAFELDRARAAGPTWVSVPLRRELQLPKGAVWWVVQSLAGAAAWHVDDGGATPKPVMQRTTDDGLSWRKTSPVGTGAPVANPAGRLRLRRTPETFTMPVALQVGGERVSLDRFAPLGRVDLSLDAPEITAAFDRALAEAGPGCSTAEHLVDGDFTRWTGLGDEVGEGFGIPLDASGPVLSVGGGDSPSALFSSDVSDSTHVALSPDGRRAYAFHGRVGGAVIHRVDLTTGRVEDRLDLTGGRAAANTFAVDPSGRLAVVGVEASRTFHLVDLAAFRRIGEPVRLPPTETELVGPSALVLSEDGNRLYFGFVDTASNSFDGGVAEIAVDRLVAAALGQDLEAGDLVIHRLGMDRRPRALARDGRGLLALVRPVSTERPNDGELLRLRPAGAGLQPDTVPIAAEGGVALARGASGSVVVARWVDRPESSGVRVLSRIDLASGRSTAEVDLSISPRSVALSPDGRRAYVVGVGGLSVVDLERRREVAVLRPDQRLAAAAVAPDGDRLLALSAAEAGVALEVFPVGIPTPVEWALLTGTATPVAFGEPVEAAVVLGGLRKTGETGSTTLAQVAPVGGGCAYDLSFEGLATEPDARVEVRWRGADGAVLGRESIPFRELTVPAVTVDTASTTDAGLTTASTPRLALHRRRLAAPGAATQAEVRIEVPAGAAVARALSLRGVTAVSGNADLRAVTDDGRVAGWNPGPAGGPRLETGRLFNPGPREASLTQTLAVEPGTTYALDLEVGAVQDALGGKGPAGRLALSWLGDDERPLGEPIALSIEAGSADRRSRAVVAPEGAVDARLELAVASGAAFEIRRAELTARPVTALPVTFVAEAPGELTLDGWEVCLEETPPTAPEVPDGGLHPPGPAEDGHGAQGGGCCCRCGGKPKAGTQAPTVTASGRPVSVATCADCNAPVLSHGGRPAADAVVLPQLATPPVRFLEPAALAPVAVTPTRAATPRPVVPLTQINGIGDARARVLADAGLDTLGALSFSTPQRVAALLNGVSEEAAAGFIREARRKLVRD
jgi:hypothetical protein